MLEKKTIPPVKVKGSRKGITFLFLTTILISFILWAKNRYPSWFKDFALPNPKSYVYEVNAKPEQNLLDIFKTVPKLKKVDDLEEKVSELLTNLNGEYGIYYYNLATKEFFGINEAISFPAASVNKIPIMVNFYKAVEKGKLKKETVYTLTKEDIQDYGTGSLRYEEPGKKYTLEALVKLIGQHSDNTAAYVIEGFIGRNTCQKELDSLELGQIQMLQNTATPKQMSEYLALLYQGDLLDWENKEKVFGFLTNTLFEDRIPKGVPLSVKVAHKIGNGLRVVNDCGIVFGSKPYSLCILSNNVLESEALEVIPKISKVIWEYNQKN